MYQEQLVICKSHLRNLIRKNDITLASKHKQQRSFLCRHKIDVRQWWLTLNPWLCVQTAPSSAPQTAALSTHPVPTRLSL